MNKTNHDSPPLRPLYEINMFIWPKLNLEIVNVYVNALKYLYVKCVYMFVTKVTQ